MARLSKTDLRRVEAINGELGRWEEATEAVIKRLLPELGSLLDVEWPCSYAVRAHLGGVRTEFAYGFPNFRGRFNQVLEHHPFDWGYYNPLSPRPKERNVVVTMTASEIVGARIIQSLREYVRGRHQLRILLCDGPTLLAWVGGFSPAPFTQRTRRLLQRLAPALRARLLTERRLNSATLVLSTIDAVLEGVAGAAFLLSDTGSIEHANTAGRQRLAAEPARMLEALRAAIAGGPGFEVTRIVGRGQPPGYLLIERGARNGAERAARLAQRLGLTPRQRQVLALLADGHTNARIASELGCSPRTVEVHVTAILRRAECESRAELVAEVWKTQA